MVGLASKQPHRWKSRRTVAGPQGIPGDAKGSLESLGRKSFQKPRPGATSQGTVARSTGRVGVLLEELLLHFLAVFHQRLAIGR